MVVKSFEFSPFMENTYVCYDKTGGVIIDPGCYEAPERNELFSFIEREGILINRLLLTHAHIDHIFGCAAVSRRFNLRFDMHVEDVPLLEQSKTQGVMFGVPVDPPPPHGKLLEEGDTVQVGSATWTVLHCPGHSPGSICFYDEANGFVIGGDVLFYGSIGRTDLWKGSFDQLLSSIRTKLFVLPDDTVVYSGHGPQTTIGFEKQHNPFLQDGFGS